MSVYLRFLIGGAVATCLFIFSFNWLVDPYGIWHEVRIAHLNALKPEVATHQRLHEAGLFERSAVSTLILGTSRADIGLDPQHGGLIQPAFNFAMSSQPLSETLHVMRMAHARHPLKQVVFATDFFTYNVTLRPPADAMTEDFTFATQWDPALATAIFFSSIRTVARQMTYDPNAAGDIWTSQGLRSWSDLGFHNLDGDRKAAMLSEYGDISGTYLPPPDRKFSFAEKGADSVAIYQAILRFAHENQIDLRILVSPSHARQWHLVWSIGLWDTWEAWKRTLVKQNEDIAKEMKRTAFPVWDFSGFNSITAEPFPSLCDKQKRMRWYWESSHYKRETGNLVLDRIFGRNTPTLPVDFGVAMNSANIDAHLRATRHDHLSWVAQHPQDVAEIARARAAGSGLAAKLIALCH